MSGSPREIRNLIVKIVEKKEGKQSAIVAQPFESYATDEDLKTIISGLFVLLREKQAVEQQRSRLLPAGVKHRTFSMFLRDDDSFEVVRLVSCRLAVINQEVGDSGFLQKWRDQFLTDFEKFWHPNFIYNRVISFVEAKGWNFNDMKGHHWRAACAFAHPMFFTDGWDEEKRHTVATKTKNSLMTGFRRGSYRSKSYRSKSHRSKSFLRVGTAGVSSLKTRDKIAFVPKSRKGRVRKALTGVPRSKHSRSRKKTERP